MKRREISINGIPAPENWKKAEASANQDIIEWFVFEDLIGLVFEDKVKVFGYDQEGIFRSKCWPLPKNYRTEDSLVLEKLKLAEAEEILKNYFASFPVNINVLEKATA